MANTDISGLLTGMAWAGDHDKEGIKRASAIQGSGVGSNLARGQAMRAPEQEQRLRQAAGGLFGVDTRTTAEQLREAMTKLDLTDPADLRKLVKLQQASGDTAGAAQTASKISALEAAQVQAGYAENQENRSATRALREKESFDLSKLDRDRQIVKDAATLKHRTDATTRQEKSLVLQQEAAAREKLRSEGALTDRDTRLAQEEGQRKLYETQARSEGRSELADAIKEGLPLTSAASILYAKTSTAAITSPKGAEKVALEKLLNSPDMQAAIPEIFQDNFWGEWGKTSDAADELIYYKVKEIRQRENNTITVDKAMLEAIKEIAKVLTPTPVKTPEQLAAEKKIVDDAKLAGGGSTNPINHETL